jgi:hypothetical protein
VQLAAEGGQAVPEAEEPAALEARRVDGALGSAP